MTLVQSRFQGCHDIKIRVGGVFSFPHVTGEVLASMCRMCPLPIRLAPNAAIFAGLAIAFAYFILGNRTP
jgi:hypothetical protein